MRHGRHKTAADRYSVGPSIRTIMKLHRILFGLTAAIPLVAALAAARQETTTPAPVDEPASYMREDRSASPPLMPWQRNLEDALALSRATGKPLLLCVNTDGELASEALAADRYRDPEFVALVQGFIPLLASPDRHDALDHTSLGVRIPDTKFGRVTNTEHISIEPELYELWFEGRRVAPRHVAVSPDGEVLFDLFLLTDLSLIDEALRKHGVFEVAEPTPEPVQEPNQEPNQEPGAETGDETSVDPDAQLEEELDEDALLQSPDATHREQLEASFRAADVETRTRLARAALSTDRATQHPEVVRLALHDTERAVRDAAVAAIYHNARAITLAHFITALELTAGESSAARDSIVIALGRFAIEATGPEAPRARRLSAAVKALAAGSEIIDVDAWLLATVGGVQFPPESDVDWAERLARIEDRLAEEPEDADWNLLFARNGRGYAKSIIAQGGNPNLVLEDVRRAAERARTARPDDALASALVAWSAYMLNDVAVAADAARDAAPGLAPLSALPIAVETLDILAFGRTRGIYAAIEEGVEWPREWLADAVAAEEVLLSHPLGTQAQALRGIQLLGALDLLARQRVAILGALKRWPDSGVLHEWYRFVVLRAEGPAGLLVVYDRPGFLDLAPAQRLSFSGLAKLRAAERSIDEHDVDGALVAYRSAFTVLERAIGESEDVVEFARWYQAQARAGRARLFMDAGKLDEALAEMLLCFSFETEAHDSTDARGVSPRETLNALRSALLEAGREADAETLAPFAEREVEADAGDGTESED